MNSDAEVQNYTVFDKEFGRDVPKSDLVYKFFKVERTHRIFCPNNNHGCLLQDKLFRVHCVQTRELEITSARKSSKLFDFSVCICTLHGNGERCMKCDSEAPPACSAERKHPSEVMFTQNLQSHMLFDYPYKMLQAFD
ncbi:hypothetical protein STEG23_032212 [Scotinomys teguina]